MASEKSNRLTQMTVAKAEPNVCRYEIWDKDGPGFGLRVEVSGTKTFIVRYRADGGGRNAPRRFVTIGRHGVLTVDQARKEARRVLGDVARGSDPAASRRAKRDEMTLADLFELYRDQGTLHLAEKTRAYTIARLQNHVVPLLSRRRLSDIRVADVERLIHDVSTGKTARDEMIGPRKRIRVRGGPGAAAKIVRDLSALLNFGVRRELLASNPCAKIRKPSDKQRHRFLDLQEIERLGIALSQLEAEGANVKAVQIIRLLLLTGCRRNEIAALRWDEVDFPRSRLVLAESKTGRSIRPLGSAAVQLLQQIPSQPNCPFVFPSERGDSHFQGTRKLWPLLALRAGLPGITNHTLRHSFGSAAASSGESPLMVGALLGHSNPRSTAIYAHLQAAPQQEIADRLSSILSNAMNSGD